LVTGNYHRPIAWCLIEATDFRRLKTIPGAGDLRRFRHHSQFLNSCGLDLATQQSGHFRDQTKIAKFGNAGLLCAFWSAGQVAIRQRENGFKDKYECYIAGERELATFLLSVEWIDRQGSRQNEGEKQRHGENR
jgi:transposase